jgi:hypothetical protein
MRSNVDPQKIAQLMKVLGREARGPGCIYFTGGASALLIGWRSSTVDIDIRLDPEPPGIFQAIAKLKQELNINIELASPQDFLPPLPGWRDRSVFIGQQGEISFYHYDFTAQALSKLSRGYNRNIGCIWRKANISVGAKHDRNQYGIITNNLSAVMLRPLQKPDAPATLMMFEPCTNRNYFL